MSRCVTATFRGLFVNNIEIWNLLNGQLKVSGSQSIASMIPHLEVRPMTSIPPSTHMLFDFCSTVTFLSL